MQKFILPFLLLTVVSLSAQDQYPQNPNVDIESYTFSLILNDSTDIIAGEAIIAASLKPGTNEVVLDLIGRNGEYGMTVMEVLDGGQPTPYSFENNKLHITPQADEEPLHLFTVLYHGIAERGLVIDTTKYGQRSFFGDNWPNLARHWLPSVDHPYDKAAVEFLIAAPEQYDVVATGKKVEESNLGSGYKLTRYVEPAPVATKVMTIGVTRFASMTLGFVGDTEVSAWVYPENREAGFSDYAVAVNVLDYFSKEIGPYPWAKLANMQAKTQWGGLENAGTIAYRESSVTGNNEVEGLIAHEIAHQWFGNSASEKNWNHVWLSEGFATYFTILYLENVYGDERRKEALKEDRVQVIDYYRSTPGPVVDTTITDPMKVLSINTYQKGGWVLNMLRHRLGDDIFWRGIRTYYRNYTHSNALTEDFRKVMEEVSGQDLSDFFAQWLNEEGFPELKWDWKFRKGKVDIRLQQTQKHHLYNFPLEIGIKTANGMVMHTVDVTERKHTFSFEVNEAPEAVILDPEVWLLFSEAK